MSTFEILEAFIALRREVALVRAEESKNFDLGYNQISILFRLFQSSATMGELASHTISDKASITRTIASLEKEGYVKRIKDPNDRRIIHIELTKTGKQIAAKTNEIRNAIGEKLDNCLSAKERKQLTSLIYKVISKLNNK